MPDISNYSALSDEQLAEILETLADAQDNPSRGVMLLEAARRLRGSAPLLPRIRTYDEHGEPHDEVLRTKTGKVITEADIAAWAVEAEESYDVSHLPPADPGRIEEVAHQFADIVRGANEDDQVKIRRQLNRADNPFAHRVLELLDDR
jgi:hypothetical protein